jgi:uncharacterized membrane protein YhaH (DUF805 family)
MDFGQAISAVFSKYATFEGRARRSEYWWWALFQVLVSLVTCWIPIINAIASLALFLPSLAVGVRRLHDINRSGWFILLPVAPFPIILVGVMAKAGGGSGGWGILAVGGLACVGLAILQLVWFCSRGTVGANRFGPDPQESVAAVF